MESDAPDTVGEAPTITDEYETSSGAVLDKDKTKDISLPKDMKQPKEANGRNLSHFELLAMIGRDTFGIPHKRKKKNPTKTVTISRNIETEKKERKPEFLVSKEEDYGSNNTNLDAEIEEAAAKIQAKLEETKTKQRMNKNIDAAGTKVNKTLKNEIITNRKIDAAGKRVNDQLKKSANNNIDDVELNKIDLAANKIQESLEMKKVKNKSRIRKMDDADETSSISVEEHLPSTNILEQNEEKIETIISSPLSNEEIDIDLGDPEVDKAALKIQASFRGKKTRKEVVQLKKHKEISEEIATEFEEAVVTAGDMISWTGEEFDKGISIDIDGQTSQKTFGHWFIITVWIK